MNSGGNKKTDVEGEISIPQLLEVFWSGKFLILVASALCFSLSVLTSFTIDDKYQAFALLVPKQEERSAIAGIAGQYSGLAGMAGVDLSVGEQGGKVAEAIRTLESFNLFNEYLFEEIGPELVAVSSYDIRTNTLFFQDDIYDSEKGNWIVKPSSQQAFKSFSDALDVSYEKESGFVTLTFEHRSPVVAKEILDILIKALNDLMRARDVNEAEGAIDFLRRKMEESDLVPLDEMFARLIEQQTKTIMLANVAENYIFRIIEPPIVPETRHSPNRTVIAIVGLILGLLLGLLAQLSKEFVLKK